MYKYGQVIAALDEFCRDHGETLEAGEMRRGALSAPIRRALNDASGFVINRNIKLVLLELQIGEEDFRPYLESST